MPRNRLAVQIGNRMKDARIRAGLEQQDVAERLGVTPGAYGNWERGDRMLPTDILAQLPAVLGEPVSALLDVPTGENLRKDEEEIIALYRGCAREVRRFLLEGLRSGYARSRDSAS